MSTPEPSLHDAALSVPGRLRSLAELAVLGTLVGGLCGSASALFLWSLERATAARVAHPWLVYLLPVAGLALGALYDKLGRPVKAGSNLVLDALATESPPLPKRMAPLVLVGTVLTHLFGGSAGREGTAVQMGASLADAFSRWMGLSPRLRALLLRAGVAGGFGSVFGTPAAGAVFALEYVVLGRVEYDALVPAVLASVVGDLATRAWGITHTHYAAAPTVALTPSLALRWGLFALAVAATAVAFIELTHAVKKLGEKRVPWLPVRMALGGGAVLGLAQLSGTDAFYGLSIPLLQRSFSDPHLPAWYFAAKLVLTAVTLGAGFLGGEVTPLFVIGAALGNALARPLGLPLELAAGVGMASLFAVASHTPLALTLMAVEVLGPGCLPHVLLVSALAWPLTGHRSIYSAQRVLRAKHGALLPRETPLRELPGP